ncbi:hypothetical protein [Sulfurisphaera tokodaii]|uniref:Uncharacterized protein n=2 Tax=Sulfurisphaera tokodaii TaxID=111955 RepID=F9VNJ4_SULTO|nr:hypothetical protein [Sulfurisphaera tokodaii]BAK54640.1 hypothetical protein STK_16730 [Sulfurisphaera tokodaii str. 7]HII73090.1 hypothetical protein [Sulfurisphaera tokodaii]
MKAVDAINELFANYRLIILTLIIAIIGAIVVGIISLLLGLGVSISSIFGISSPYGVVVKLILSIIVSIFYMFALAISIYSYKRYWDISRAFSSIGIFFSDAIIAGIALGLVNFIFSYIPVVGILISALVFTGLALSFSISERGKKIVDSMNEGFSAISSLIRIDAVSLLILYIAAILSFIPILNIFTIPYVAVLSSLLTK